MAKYTVYGDHTFDEYIDSILEDVRRQFEKVIDCDKIHALILGGGYGRGEGGVFKTPDGDRLYNDLDLFVISKKLPPWEKKRITRKLKELHHELSENYGIDVDFSDLKCIDSLPKAPFTLMWYDLKQKHTVIYGRKNILKYLPNWNGDRIPHMEALKLLLNRAMGLYFAKEYLDNDRAVSEYDFINRNIHKAYQALGEAILITEGTYHWSNVERIARIENTDVTKYTSSNIYKARFAESMAFKLQPHKELQPADILYNRLQEVTGIFQEVYFSLWAMYLGVSQIDYLVYKDKLMNSNLGENALVNKLKNLALNLKDCRMNGFDLNLFTSYPRLRLFYVLPWLVFDEKLETGELCEKLGLSYTEDTALLQKRFVRLWQRYN